MCDWEIQHGLAAARWSLATLWHFPTAHNAVIKAHCKSKSAQVKTGNKTRLETLWAWSNHSNVITAGEEWRSVKVKRKKQRWKGRWIIICLPQVLWGLYKPVVFIWAHWQTNKKTLVKCGCTSVQRFLSWLAIVYLERNPIYIYYVCYQYTLLRVRGCPIASLFFFYWQHALGLLQKRVGVRMIHREATVSHAVPDSYFLWAGSVCKQILLRRAKMTLCMCMMRQNRSLDV